MPKEYDPQELAAQTDPLVLYVVVRESLGMSPGKIAAQVGHAIDLLLEYYYVSLALDPVERQGHYHSLMKAWKEESRRKVALRADEKEWEKLKAEFPEAFIVRDAGLTQVEPGSETVVALWPMRKSERPKLLKRLQALK